MNIFNYFRKKGIDTVDASFYRKIDEWISWYNSNVRQFTFYKVYTGRGTSKRCRRKSMGMAKKLSEDIADLLLNERVMITLEDETTQEFVRKVLDNNHFLVMGNDYQERKAYSGTVAYIPYLYNAVVQEDGTISAGEIGINYVDAKNIYPVSWNNGNVTECVFTFVHTVRQKKYVQIQFHRIEPDGVYVIENNVLECTKGSAEGRELTEQEWKQLKPFANLAARTETGSTEPQFVIDRLNITNNADECNPMGIAIFANAIDTLKKLDMEFDSLPEDYDKSQTGLIKEVDMSLRVEQHSKAINDDLNYLSLKCGFGTERYRFDGAGAKTATEIISENSDMYRMLKKHETILEDVLKRLIRIIIRLGIVTGNTLDQNTDIVIDFDDSIIEDKGAERQQDRQDVSMGVMRHEEYRAKWYGETVEQAKKNLPEQNQVME